MSIRSLAEGVHISRANAYARVGRLVADGVITGFSVRIAHERAGLGTSAYVVGVDRKPHPHFHAGTASPPGAIEINLSR